MKMFRLSTVLFFGILISLTVSCKKYPDGPSFSLRSKKERLANTWKIQSGQINGVDRTNDFLNTYYDFKVVIDKGGNYSLNYRLFNFLDYSESGTWVWNGDKTHVFFNKIVNGSITDTHDFKILRLKEKELWYEDVQSNGEVWEIHLIPN